MFGGDDGFVEAVVLGVFGGDASVGGHERFVDDDEIVGPGVSVGVLAVCALRDVPLAFEWEEDGGWWAGRFHGLWAIKVEFVFGEDEGCGCGSPIGSVFGVVV